MRGRSGWAGGAVRAVAAVEVRRRWRSLLGIGLAVGLLGAVVVGSLVVARRTATAFDRLVVASAAGDARALVFEPELAEPIADLPEVSASWTATLAVARLEGPGVVYSGWVLGPAPPPGLQEPVVVAGREADPTAVDEVVVVESYADELGVGPGDELRYRFLAPEELAMFDTGFGEPDGPAVTVEVVGILRVPGGLEQSPVVATPAFATRYGREVGAGRVVLLRLRDGAASLPALRAGVDRLAEQASTGPGAEEFVPVELTGATGDPAVAGATARVLVVGLAVLAAVSALVGTVTSAQALTRHHAAGSGDQRVESELGLTAAERTAARCLALLPAALVAAALVAAGALAAGLLEPPGPIEQLEPSPGWAPNVALAAAGAAVTAAVVLALGAATARRAGVAPRAAGRARPTRPRLTAVPLPAPAAVGLGLAVAHPRNARSTPTRSSLLGVVLAVTGVVAAAIFAASLDRLVGEPARWGWHGDVVVVDTTPEMIDELLADERVAALTVVDSSTVGLDGERLDAYALTDRRSSAGWTVTEGRPPRSAGEVLVGTRVAARQGLDVGDRVAAASGASLRVVGVGLGPVLVGEGLGDSVLLTPDGLARHGRSAAFTESMVRAVPGQEASLVADLGSRYEVTVREPPAAVADLGELDALPVVLGAFLSVVGLAALTHALAGTVRRRSRDLAVLRVVGFSPAQTGWALVAMALATTAIGLAAGVPLGLLVGRFVWWAVADANAVATDPALPGVAIVGLVGAALVVAGLAAVLPARAAAAVSPGDLLRDD